MSDPWQWCESGPGTPGWNMAFDDCLLSRAGGLVAPVFRAFAWTHPAVTFGYFQRVRDVEGQVGGMPLVRRPSAGGIVVHDVDEWTYGVLVPAGHPLYRLRAEASYRWMHEWIRAAFERLGVAGQLAASAETSSPGVCFAGWERFDLLVEGRKIAGAAQRRTRDGLLIQGSVRGGETGLERRAWEAAMRSEGEEGMGIVWGPFRMTPEWKSSVDGLVESRYSVGVPFQSRR